MQLFGSMKTAYTYLQYVCVHLTVNVELNDKLLFHIFAVLLFSFGTLKLVGATGWIILLLLFFL